MEDIKMPEEYIIGDDGRVRGFNKTFGYVPIQTQEILEALRFKSEMAARMKTMVTSAVDDFAERLYSSFIVMKHDSEFDQDIVEKSEYYIDTIRTAVLSYKPEDDAKAPRCKKEAALNKGVIDVLSKATNIKMDTLDSDKSYIITMTFDTFDTARSAIGVMGDVVKDFQKRHVNLSFVFQVKEQGITYNISEVK